ncbi:hypothetical protein BDW59DRAFT_140211 [Aspergillus cavernicola]|uniref:Clr5 domain-containing protein n=1 Tax=Aspergillus cavernicola TaxID=176166 RepID=A0ABR4IUR1_9EURO
MGSSRPRLRVSSGGPANKKKLSLDEQRALIDEYGIRFQGPLLSTQWPASYALIFSKVREIEDVKYERYRSSLDSCPRKIQRVRTLNRVHRLVRGVSDCRKSSLNEEEWRRSTEFYLLQHFNDEIAWYCGSCGNRTWVAEFKFDPSHSTSTNSGRNESPAVIPVCSCNPNETIQAEVPCESSRPFITRLGMPIVDASSPAKIGVKKPDAVVGLRNNPQIREMLDNITDIASHPANDPDMLFPFLVLEAKSEVGGPGFQSIETQTAFPIRSLVNFQESLNQHREARRPPLVWFLAYQGDLWRVYACIQDDNLTKVVELWQGTVLKYDDALQLNLIIDFIYEWAIEVYRKEIFGSFSDSGRLNTSHGKCAGKTTPEMMDSLIDLTIEDCSLYSRDVDVVSLSWPSSDIQMLDLQLDEDVISDPSPVAVPEEYEVDWNSYGAIRNADEVFFTFHHIVLPETLIELTAILSSISPNDTLIDVASTLLQLFHIEDPIVVNRGLLAQLESLWTEGVGDFGSLGDHLLIAHISFRSYFRPTDWQPIRSLSCIAASISAINILASIALDGFDSLLNRSMLSLSCLEADIVLPLRKFSGQESAAAAAQDLSLSIQKEMAGPGYRWFETLENGRYVKEIWHGLDTHTPSIPLFDIMVYSSFYTTIGRENSLDMRDATSYARLSRTTQADGALVLKRPSSWPAQCPKYCLTIFDTSDINYLPYMGQKILRTISHGGFYQESGRGIQEDDRRAMQGWAQFLLSGFN